MAHKEEIIQEALTNFLQEHNAESPDGCIDEIVLSYVVGILEDLGTENGNHDLFDVDSFTEMMEAYLPGFGEIDNVQVCEWMFQLAANLQKGEQNTSTQNGHCNASWGTHTDTSTLSLSPPTQSAPVEVPPGRRRKNYRKTSGSQSSEESHSLKKESTQMKQGSSPPVEAGGEEEQVRLLREMFPAACSLEVSHCLSVAQGQVEKAAQLLLHRQETGETITSTQCATQTGRLGGRKTDVLLDDHQMKESILNKYSYVDTEDDTREHRPAMSLQAKDTKKLVRYLDSKVVSTKGERFTEIKRDDEVDPKKFNINLKPAKQYRFH